MQFPITIGLHRSRFIDGGVIVFVLLAAGATLAFPQAALVQGLALLVTGGFAAWLRRQLTPALSAIRLERSGLVFIQHGVGDVFVAAEILPGATVHPWLTVIRFKPEGAAAATLIATVDSLKPQDFRRLRVFLRWLADFQLNDPNDAV